MTIDRDRLIDKIRALLSKTVDNGCSEHEALAALDKARAMMDAYEVTEADLQLSKAEAAVLREDTSRDPHGIRSYMAMAVAEFCDCKVWKGQGGIVFCGLPSDAQLAKWLLQSLGSFVQGELANHLMGNLAPKGQRRLIINGFVGGCAKRINERLRELIAKSKVQTASSTNSTALVVIKGAAVAEKMKAIGIHLGKARTSRRSYDGQSYLAGKAAGERASFGRPVSGGQARITG